MKYTTYLFDFDYTLADSSRGIVICFRNVLERHGHTGISDEAITHHWKNTGRFIQYFERNHYSRNISRI